MRKKIYAFIAILFCVSMGYTQITPGFSIKQTTYKTPQSASIADPNPKDATVQLTYFDGLGRPIQKKAYKQSGEGKDIIVPIEYDASGIQTKEYLPYASSASSLIYEQGDIASDKSFYATQYPYSEKILEKSPLNRVQKQAAPGNDWTANLTGGSDHTIKFEYATNADNEFKFYTVTATCNSNGLYDYTNSLSATGSYSIAQLSKTIVKNENWVSGTDNTTEEYKDNEGKLILKRSYDGGEKYDTYYVYDQFGNLTYVIPPIVDASTGTISSDSLNDYCYQYKYDKRNRLVEKKLPGKNWEYIVYDSLDRVVATGPAYSPFTDGAIGWTITKYDVINRVIITGWMPATVTSATRFSLQTSLDAATIVSETTTGNSTVNSVSFQYTGNVWPKNTDNYHVLTVNYYDNYSNLAFTPAITFITGGYNNSDKLPIGLPTMSWVRVLEATTAPIRAEKSYVLYDKKGRAVRTYKENYLGGYTKVESSLEPITGRLNQTITSHKKLTTDAELVITDNYSYTDQDRLLKHLHQIGSGTPQLLAKHEYNKLGQLITKRLGNKSSTDTDTGIQKVDFNYNIRGWLQGINDITNLTQAGANADLFAYKINYNTTDSTTGIKQYNGNISETTWVTSDNFTRRYNYTYDQLNRMTEAYYSTPFYSPSTADNAYRESVTYDKNGNIRSLLRNEKFSPNPTDPVLTIDNLIYSYAGTGFGNRPRSISDTGNATKGFTEPNPQTGDDYSYDNFGNMTVDNNKGITLFTYNHLNLPNKITFGTTGTIEYLYNATGQKIYKKVIQSGTTTATDYLDGFQYTGGSLQIFPHAEGYITPRATMFGTVYDYVFNYTDHLGNVLVSYSDMDGNGTLGTESIQVYDTRTHSWKTVGNSSLVGQNNYYPSGLIQGGYNYLGSNNSYKYKFNGQEYQDELGLNTTAMDFRQYDAAIGRFNVIDPLAENHPDMTPYHFGANNPVYWSDPSGLDIVQYGQNMITFTGAEAAAFFNAWNGGGGVIHNNDTYSDPNAVIDTAFAEIFGGQSGDGYDRLNNVIIYKGLGGSRNANIIQGHAYWTGIYYDSWRSGQYSKQWDSFQSGLDWLGAAPIIGEPIDFMNGGISAIRGNYGAAALSMAAMIPVAGWGATALKQSHHVIPKAVYKEMAGDLGGLMKLNGAENLMDLPVPFHGNHPQYSNFVKESINNLRESGKLSPGSIEALQGNLRGMINEALESGQKLNDYFRQYN